MSTDWSIVRKGALLLTPGKSLLFFEQTLPFDTIRAFDPVYGGYVVTSAEGIGLAPVEVVEKMSQRMLDLHIELYPEIYSPVTLQERAKTTESAFSQQVDGKHYSEMPDGYQPFQISHALGLNPVEHTILKYLLRHRRKNGKVDLEKIKHCVDILIEQEYPNE